MKRLTLALLFLAASVAEASTTRPLAFGELVGSATAIVRGTVISSRARWTDSRTIRTEVIFQIHRVLKGSVGGSLALTFLGGHVDDVELSVPGMPRFVENEEVILFVQTPEAGSPLVGFMQGRFRVTRTPDGTTSVLTHDHHPFTSVPAIGAAPPAFSAVPIRPMSLAAFEAAIMVEARPR